MTVRLAAPSRGAAVPALDAARLRARAEALLAALDRADAELSVALVPDAEIAALNERWRGRAGPTDVLSFSLVEGEHADRRGGLLGDVVIGFEVAARQAAEAGHALDDELLRLLIHGVLHLLGHDHQVPAQARAMAAEERRLREIVGA